MPTTTTKTTAKTDTAKRAPDDESELIDNLDVLADLDVLKSEPDWRLLKDSDHLDKYIKKTGNNAAASDSPQPSQGERHD